MLAPNWLMSNSEFMVLGYVGLYLISMLRAHTREDEDEEKKYYVR